MLFIVFYASSSLNALYIIHLQSIKETSNTYINHRKICVYKEKNNKSLIQALYVVYFRSLFL